MKVNNKNMQTIWMDNNSENIKIIDQNNVLIVISDNDQLYLIMYNLKNNKIVSKIGR